MATTGGDVLIETIMDWGVDVIFGLPGDGINGIMEALRQRQDRIRFVQVRHEETAALMACRYATPTGRLARPKIARNSVRSRKFAATPVLINSYCVESLSRPHTQSAVSWQLQ